MSTSELPDLASLSPAKRQLLLKLLRRDAARTESGRAIPRRADSGPAPLSFAQQRLWFLDRLTPGSPAYNVSFAVRLNGDLQVAALQRALAEIVRRHEVLRARFETTGASPVQVIVPDLDLPLPLVDLQSVADSEGATHRLATVEARRPFDLARGPLLRAVLLRRAADDHVVLLTLHHIVSDGWSIDILTREVAVLYAAFVAGQPSPLPELPIQFSDYAVWQRNGLQGEVLAGQLAYWRDKLAGSPNVLELPADRPRPAVPSFLGASRGRVLGSALLAGLGKLARGGDATLFMVVLAAFQALLSRYSRQDDILVGSPIANRTLPELETLIGFFVNTLVLRCRLEVDSTFRQLLARARETTLGAHEHQDLPFERLIDELGLERSLSHSPLFQVVLTFQNVPDSGPAVPPGGLAMSLLPSQTGTAKFDLTLVVEELGDRLATHLEYRTDLFDGATIDRLLGHLETLLSGVSADGQARVLEVPLLGAGERGQLLAWSGVAQTYALSGSLHGRFESWARETPEAVAVVSGEERLSYGDLDRRANRLAHRLLESGVVPGSRVCLAVERGCGLVEGILGILKAGCAYVPLDPSYPAERLSWVLADAGAALVVSDASGLESLRSWSGSLLLLGEEGGAEQSPGLAVDPTFPAYVIYTSGSTGRPKGVVVSHGNVLRLMSSTEDWFGFGREDVWTLFHSFAFDFSVWELWGALSYGGRVVIVPYLVSRSPESLLELIDGEGVTVLNQTPSAFRSLQQAEGERPAVGGGSLRWVIFGGEALEPRSLAGWWRRHGAVPGLVNMYGITETTVHVTWRRLGESEILGGAGSVIGVPLRDLGVYVVDGFGAPVPVGVAGELCVGGAGVSQGYLGRPELTASRFVPDGFGCEPGGRLYRSGDLGRWQSSGELEYLGRIDSQVKVRGFRIELGEIESTLLQQPGVEAAVVLAREDTPGNRRLVAYVVVREGSAGAEELRSRLKERLPEYMVPSVLLALESLPLTANGKVDRRALPAPGGDRPELGSEYVAPRTPVEEVLAAIWSQVLGLERVGMHDNFFALGGDSILSLRVVALAGERGLSIGLPDLFQHQTIADLGESLGRLSAPSERVRSEPLSLLGEEDRQRLPADVEDAYPLATLQAGMLYHMELTPEDPQYHNVDSWHVRGRFEAAPFAEAVRRVVARHPMLRTSFALTGYSEPLQLVHRHAELPVTLEDLRSLSPEEQEAALDGLVRAEKQRCFDLTRAPQLRFHVALRSAATFQFTLTENHAIFDGWSLHSTLAEIFELYFALLSGGSPEARAPLRLSYREYVRLEREALGSAESEDYWRRLLSDAELVELPRWPLPESRLGARRVGTLEVAVPASVTAGLKGLSRSAAVPLKSVLLAVHCKVLSLLSGRADVVTGLVSNGRLEEREGDEVRGLFLNTLPLRLRLPEGSWSALARAAFDAEQRMLPHRRYPFGALQRQRGERPLFDIAFNYIHFHVVRDLMQSGHLEILGFRQAEGGNFRLQAHFSLDLEQRGLDLQLEYDAHDVPAAQVREIADLYLLTLEAMAGDPQGSHAGQSLMSPAVRHQCLLEWNATSASYPGGERCLHTLFEEQVLRTPESRAVEIEGGVLSYRELSSRSSRLARYLQRLGVRAETRVGICAERSLDLVVGLLGILKAGGAYVPLDPEYPRERLSYMVEDSGVQVVLSQARLSGVLAGSSVQQVQLDLDWAEISRESAEAPEVETSPENLAYVIYTSGSTGRPKGAMNTHRGIVNRLLWMQSAYGLDGRDAVLQKTPASFDVSVWEFFWPLLTGARLVLARPGGHRDGDYLVSRIVESGVTTLHFVPSMLRAFLETEGVEGCRSLTRVMSSGEALPADVEARFFARLGGVGCALHNLYGPTEAAVDVTFWRCTGVGGVVPIGRPIGNTQIYLLDRGLSAVPLGVAGELYIGGVSLARGYGGRAELTAERFVPSPWGVGERLYRTGDLARYGRDGAIEYLGRTDHQVKVRGFRIELGEIETVLGQHPGVRACTVVAREEGGGERRLVAYVVEREGALSGRGGVEELRGYLRERLPEHMVASAFVLLESLPLTPSGKVDRRALPAPSRDALDAGAFEPPRTWTEEVLATVWSEVLGVERVGRGASFFDLGGHSLLATRLISRVRQAFRIDLPLRSLFATPALADFARTVDAAVSAGRSATPPIVPQARDVPPPLSFAQQRLWLIDQMELGSAAYNMPLAVRLDGGLDPGALAWALAGVVRRHEVLRTTFHRRHGDPVQVIAAPEEGGLPLPIVDLSDLPAEKRRTTGEALMAEEAVRPFDLARGPVLRLGLLRLGPSEHLLLLTLHHIAADGWSLGILVDEVTALYRAGLAGTAPVLPELPVQYADFALWQRGWLQGEVLESELSYWRQRLQGGTAVLELPTDRPRPAVPTQRGAGLGFALDVGLSAALRAIGRRDSATPFMVLLATLATLLARYTGRDDVSIGSPMAGRDRIEIESLIGFFVNTLVLRISLAEHPAFTGLLHHVREISLEAHAHQALPFERLVEELLTERNLSRSPLFQVAFVLQNAPAAAASPPAGLRLTPLASNSPTAKFDLTLEVIAGGPVWSGSLEYACDLFDGTTAERMLGHFQNLLAGIAANPERVLAALPILSAAEQHQTQVEWSAPATAYPRDAVIHELFADQVERTPDALAVAWDGGSLSYLELDRRANRLAHDLRGLGVGPETTVALCLERSAELIVAILGVLKAGGAYVPLDPALPRERLALILAEVSPRALVVRESLPDRLSAIASLPLVRLQADRGLPACRDCHAPPVAAWAESLAYVLYTSGSTGEPKGVAVPHRAVVRLVRGNDFAELGPGVDFLQLAPASFDAATLEIWGPLLNGGRVVIPPPGALSLEEIGDAVTRFAVTALWLTAGLFHEMADSRLSALGTVRQLLAGGDVLSAPHARRVLAERPGRRLINGYGPTENTTFTCCHGMTDPAQVGRTVAIGRPIANTRVHLLDSAGRSVPIGVPGELWTGGDGLARGYLNRPGQTADRWRPDAVSGRPGERLYATGDLARYLPDGSLEFLGRIDQQVKIRGFRVEPGEIEAALRDLAALDAVVVPREDLPGGKALVAYLATPGGASPDVSALRGLLGERLPDYMIPAFFVPLDALPLTANGKVDRRALARLPLPDQPAAGTFVAPRTPVQELLAGIFSEVLQLESIGIGEDFFALGGHSLLATQVISRAVRAFRVAVSLRDLFVAPTIAGLASRVEELLRDGTAPAAPPLVAVAHDGPLPLSYAQQRMWFLDLMEPGGTTYNLPFAVRMEGEIDRAILAAAWAGIVHRHEVLRTFYRSVDGAPVQVIGPEGASHLTVIDLTAIGESRRPSLWAELRGAEASRSFDLSTGPVARALLLQLGEGEHLLLLTLHHIAADGWSLRILVEELTAFYAAGLLGKAAELAPLTVQYADFAVWQRATGLPDEVLESELSHWRQRLGSAPAVLELPADRPRPPVRMSRGASRGFALEEDLSAALTALGRRSGGTPFLVFLAAFQSLLGRYTGQRDFNVGTPIAGRDRVEIEPLIGFFVNTLVLRANLAEDPTFRQLIERARETFLDAHSHKGVPFERLVEELAPERSLSHSPLFQVAFALQNAPEAKAAPPTGLRWSPLPAPSQVAKFDLTLEVGRQGGRWAGSVEYATDLFDAVTVERLLGHFRRVLVAVAADPGRRLSEIPLLADWERGQLLVEWNDTRARFPACRSIPELFRRQASLTPEAPAVSSAEELLTYGELDRRTNRLAHRLRALGVGPDVPVAVCMERSPAWIAALLGILKAGGVYVPLDPDHPEERLAFMVRDCGAQISLVDDRGSAALPAAGTRRLRLEDEAFAGEPEVAPVPVAEPDHLAYVIYTSGSTGIPKGVALTHRGLLNLVHWHCAAYGVSAADRATQVASQAFDAAVWEIWPYLSAGASLRFVSRESRVDIPELLGELARDAISIGFLPTPLAEALLSERWPGLPALRYLLTGGDALERRPSSGLPFVLVNHYGPTEATVVATSARVSPDGPARPPIGRPIANTRLYVMDAWSQPAPLGVVGELCIAGLGLARGYVGRPELTAERFVPDPFGCEPGGRLYRSGDLVRALPEGDLAFIGRLDHQVKVRGLRIELGEIEAELKRQPGVRDAVVLVREGPTGASRGEKRLVAYVVPEPEAPPAADEIRRALRRTLPEHMVPGTVVFLAALPLSLNGKVDRRALSASDLAVEEESFDAPRSATEEAVAAIWADVLERERVGIHSSFFDLGGHSLLATRVMSRVRDAFRVELPLRRLFEEPTVAALARAIEASAPADRDEVAELESALEALEGLSDEEVLRLLMAREPGEGAHSG